MVQYLYLLINCVNGCCIHFHHVHLLLLGVRLSLSEPHSCIFRSIFGDASIQCTRKPPNGSIGTVLTHKFCVSRLFN